MTDVDLIRSIPLFAGLDEGGLAHFLQISRRTSFDAGAVIVRQGRPADSAFILADGRVEVITALPGGGELTVAELGPGSIVGEMAFLENAVRSATVVAREACSGYLIEGDSFRTLLAQHLGTAFEVQDRIARMLCRRLRDLNARIIEASGPEAEARDAGAGIGGERQPPAFEWHAFLPLLPAFRRFRPEELAVLRDSVDVFAVERGAALLSEGDAPDAAYAVLRGAVEILRRDAEGRMRRVGILGPGRLVGILALIEDEPQSLTVRAREPAVLMEIGRPLFERLYRGRDRLAARFQNMVHQELLLALSRTNVQLTRLISQARIRARRGRKVEVEALEAALTAGSAQP